MSLPAESDGVAEGPVSGRRGRWIKITARMGVWGMILATTPALAELVGVHMDPSLTGPVGAAGLFTSGTGVILTSVLVLRALPPGLGPLKLAAVAGIPFGLALISGGAAVVRPLGAFADAIDAAGPIVLIIGIVLVLLLIIGFIQGPGRDGGE